jgi:cell division protein FtsW
MIKDSIYLSRSEENIWGRWWWSIDRWLLASIMILIGIGVLLQFSATPPVANRLGIDSYYFVKRQLVFLAPSMVVMFLVSMMEPRLIRRMTLIMLVGMVALMVLTLVTGVEVNGARRWISVMGLRVQPSEFVKPAFAVISAWLISYGIKHPEFHGTKLSMLLCGLICGLLVVQPDVGMTATIVAIWSVQFFLSGAPLRLISAFGALCGAGLTSLYFTMPHVKSRIDRFIHPASGDTYQVDTAAAAFKKGGLLGRGPGEGRIKEIIPDAHTDFIMAVAGEEFGLLISLAIIFLLAFIVLRSIYVMLNSNNSFALLGAAGIVTQFAVQSFINIASTVSLIPSKGMTLPFVSYGGSSLLSLSIAAGILLALTSTNSEEAYD